MYKKGANFHKSVVTTCKVPTHFYGTVTHIFVVGFRDTGTISPISGKEKKRMPSPPFQRTASLIQLTYTQNVWIHLYPNSTQPINALISYF